MSEPTSAQAHILTAIQEVTQDGWPASVREVMRAAGLTSPSTAHIHLRNLEAAGLVERNPRPSGKRSWRLAR